MVRGGWGGRRKPLAEVDRAAAALVREALRADLFNIAGRCQFTATAGGRLMRCGRQATFEVTGMHTYELCKQHAKLYGELTRVGYEVRPLKGGRVTRAKSVKKPKGSLESPETKLAKLVHESGRKAVELGQVVNKVPGQPFYTWDELAPEAKMGRVLMAKYLLDKRRRVTMKGIFASR